MCDLMVGDVGHRILAIAFYLQVSSMKTFWGCKFLFLLYVRDTLTLRFTHTDNAIAIFPFHSSSNVCGTIRHTFFYNYLLGTLNRVPIQGLDLQ